MGVLQLLCLVMCATAATAHTLEKRAAEVDQERRPSKPINLRVSEAEPNATTFSFEDPQHPNGPLAGYIYEMCEVKSCDVVVARGHCRIAKELERYQNNSFQVGGMALLEYYKILLWAYNKDSTRNRRLHGDFVQLCTRAPPLAVGHVRDFDLRCNSEQGIVKVTWKLPSHNIPEDYELALRKVSTKQEDINGVKWERHNVNLKTCSGGGLCSYTVEGRRGEGLQEVEFSPFYKDVGPLRSYTIKERCFFPRPPPVKEIQVVDDPALDKTQQTIEIPADLFSDFNVTLNETDFLVAQDSQIGECNRSETWHEAHSHDPIGCYSFPLFHEHAFPRSCNKTGHTIRCVLGIRQNCARCDGPLKLGARYGVKLRGKTEEGYVDSKAAFFTAGSTSGGSASTTDELTTVQEVASSTAGTPPGATRPPPVKEIQVVDDPALDKTQQTIEIPADLFSDFNVTLNETDFLVAQDSQIGECNRSETWHEAHSHDPIGCYSFPLFHEHAFKRSCNKTGHTIRCVLGIRQNCARCDGPLKLGARYGVKLRGKTEEGYVDSKAAFFTAGSTSGGSASTTDELTTVQEVASSTAGTPPGARGSATTIGGSSFLLGGTVALTVLIVRI